jgi:hypothetical protein
MSTKLINGFQRCIMSIFQCSLLLTCVEASSVVSTAVPATTAAIAPVATTSVAIADPAIAPVPTAPVSTAAAPAVAVTPAVAMPTASQPVVPPQSLSTDEKLQQLHDQIDEANNHMNEQVHQQLVTSITDKHKRCADLEIDVKRLKKRYSLRLKELYQLKATIAENEEKLKALIGK